MKFKSGQSEREVKGGGVWLIKELLSERSNQEISLVFKCSKKISCFHVYAFAGLIGIDRLCWF